MLTQEVGEESKLARSFERIRSIVRKKRLAREANRQKPKLEEIVNEVMVKRRSNKDRLKTADKHFLSVEIQQKTLYRHSYQVNLIILHEK